jgi:undecaprenyl-diphosphatase
MLSAFQALLLGIVQGLGEFLPISSSAHLILVPRYLNWPDPGLAFDVALHLGTLLAVLIYFRTDLIRFVHAFLSPRDVTLASDRRLVGQILLATVPGAVLGLLFEHRIETTFRSPGLVACTLIGLGVVLALADRLNRGNKEIPDITWTMALAIGLAQGLALIPGISRSGITITTALFLGVVRPAAARFSFLMSIPIIAGAGILKAPEIFAAPDKLPVLLGFTGSAVSGFLAIWILLRYVQARSFMPFVVYRWLLGAFVLFNLQHFR